MVQQIYRTGLWLASFSNLLGDNIVIILAESIRDNYSEGIKMFFSCPFLPTELERMRAWDKMTRRMSLSEVVQRAIVGVARRLIGGHNVLLICFLAGAYVYYLASVVRTEVWVIVARWNIAHEKRKDEIKPSYLIILSYLIHLILSYLFIVVVFYIVDIKKGIYIWRN